jgi:hypothetical protein
MGFCKVGPDVPDGGDVIFICGPGVSMTAGLLSFRGLVEQIYAELEEDWRPYPAENAGMEKGAPCVDNMTEFSDV